MKIFSLGDIRENEDIDRSTSSVVSATMKTLITVTKSKAPAISHSEGRSFLGKYLKCIGYPNPSETVTVKSILRCLIGHFFVTQMNYQIRLPEQDSMFHEYVKLLPDLLEQAVKGQSYFLLYETETAATEACVYAYIKKPQLSAIKEAYFDISNAKTPLIDIKLCLTLHSNTIISIALSKYLQFQVGSIGITLAEYVKKFCYSRIETVHEPY